MRLLAPLALLIGCASPKHLQYDHGRASAQAFSTQGNLSRPEVAEHAYPIQGTEAWEIRTRVTESIHGTIASAKA